MQPERSRILLTGATGSIGQAAAYRLAQAGASLLLAGRTPAALLALAQSLEGIVSGEVHWHKADLTDAASVAALADAAARWGCNAVIHGAAAPCFGWLDGVSLDAMEAVVHTNLLAPMRLTRALLPHLRAQPRSQVLFIGSILGAVGEPGFSVLSATEFGLRGFAQALRRELADSAVRVQYLAPRNIRTPSNSPAVEAYLQATGSPADAPEQVADVLLEMLVRDTPERFIGWPQKLLARLNGLAPGLLEPRFRRHRKVLQQVEAARSTDA